MHSDKITRKVLQIILILTIFFAEFKSVDTVYADDLRFYNYNTESNVNYSGKKVSYIYNNKELSLTYPGIIISGTALADFEELFVRELGLTASMEGDVITISDGTTELLLTLGSKKVKLNGETEKMSVAPVKLQFDDTIKYYVPTRYVAEAFGFNYIWNSNTSTVKLTKTLILSINAKTILYNNTFYGISYQGNRISLEMPALYYEGYILAPAKAVFEAVGCEYQENSSTISIAKGDISLTIELNSHTAYINEQDFDMDFAPVSICNLKTNMQQIYVPLEFVAAMLGFELSYNDAQCSYTLQETEYTGNLLAHPELKALFQTPEAKIEEQEPTQYYFEWTPEEPVVTSSEKCISKVMAYALNDADVLEIYGITRDDIYDFMDNRALIFELKSVVSSMDTQFFADFEIPHLNYVLMTTVNNNTKFFFMIPLEDQWYFVEQDDCVQIYFMHADLSMEDLVISSEPVEKIIQEEPTVVYPEDQLIVLLPESIDQTQIKMLDNYLDNNFQIMIPGNQMAFYEQNFLLNPYECIEDVTLSYDIEKNHTIITCHTAYICGYKYTFEDNYLAFTVGKPDEIYNKIVVLDAGHGGKDPGAVYNGVSEKDVNFSIMYRTKELFENSDIKVYYTRESDVFIKLENRTKFVKEVNADLFISLHMNASVYETAKGTEVFYSKSNNQALESGLTSYKMGKVLADNLCVAMNSSFRGVTKSDYYVVEHNSVPAVLIELGFISNLEECSRLTNEIYQQKTANAIYQSVIEIFSAYPTGR